MDSSPFLSQSNGLVQGSSSLGPSLDQAQSSGTLWYSFDHLSISGGNLNQQLQQLPAFAVKPLSLLLASVNMLLDEKGTFAGGLLSCGYSSDFLHTPSWYSPQPFLVSVFLNT